MVFTAWVLRYLALHSFLCCDQHHDQKHLGKKEFISAHITFHHKRKSGQELQAGAWEQEMNRGHGGLLLTDLFPLACSTRFPLEPRTTSLHVALVTMDLALPHQSPIKKMLYRLDTAVLPRHFLHQFPPLASHKIR